MNDYLTDYFVGLDLGQTNDFSALAIAIQAGRAESPHYAVRHIERIPRGTSYPAVVQKTADTILRIRARHANRLPAAIWLTIDKTGVGAAVADLFREEQELDAHFLAVTITGADTITADGDEARVPKRDLASTTHVLLGSNRIEISPRLQYAQTLKEELVNFRVKIGLNGHDSYGAGADWREGNHDDLVLALALALWRGEWERSKSSVGAFSYSYIGDDDPGDDRLVGRW